MNNEDLDNIEKQTQKHFACEKKCNSKNAPESYVCVRCGKCYHKECIIKKKDAFHITGHLISCCSK